MGEKTFIAAVQEGKIKQPTQLDFSPDKWTLSFQAYKVPSENDKRVYTAGLWFNDRLSQIRQVLDNYQLAGLENTEFRRLFVAAINQQYAVLVHASGEDIKAHSGQTFPAGHMIERTLPIGPNGQQINPYDVIESMVSALRYPLAETYQSNDNSLRTDVSDLEILKIIKGRLSLASFYAVLSDLWLECLWNGWSVNIKDEFDVIQSPQTVEYMSVEISQFRRDAHLLELSWHTLRYWENLPVGIKREELDRPRIIDIERIGKKKRFKIGYLTDLSIAPRDFTMNVAVEQLYWDELLLQPLPKIEPVTIRELLLMWDVLSSLGKVLEDRLRSDTSAASVNSLLEFAPKFEIAEIIKAITRATGLSHASVLKAVKLLSFSGSVKHDPWMTPLIPVSPSECCIIIPALTVPNLVRSIEYWMKESGFDLSTRGGAFEVFARKEIGEFASESKVFADLQVYSRPLKINRSGVKEEIDLACFWRNTIIIGEIKCSVYPATPIEYYKYYSMVQGAVGQIKRKANFVRMHIHEFLKRFKVKDNIDTDAIQVHPIVLTNLEIGVGFPIEGVPIVDLGILRVYFEGKQDFFAQLSKEKGLQPALVKHYYSDEIEAEKNLLEYLLMPPSFQIYCRLLDRKINPISMPGADEANLKPYYYAQLFVNDSKLTEVLSSLSV